MDRPEASNPGELSRQLSEALQREESLKKQLAEAQQLSREASETHNRFVAHMSHEIRTPLNGIMGIATLLQECSLTPECSWYVDMILESTHALRSLVNDVLDYAAIENGSLKRNTVKIDIRRLLHDTTRGVAVLAYRKGLECACTISPRVPRILQCDPLRVRQITENLLNNALKFTDRGAISLSCDIGSITGERANIQLRVKDTGQGIEPEHLERVFDRFWQAPGSATSKTGTGLGLAICHALAEALGGSIRVESKKGEGTAFICTLPMEVVSSQDDSLPPAPPSPSWRILLVGPRVSPNLSAIRQHLEHQGIGLHEAHNIMAIETVGKKHDAVILDMPSQEKISIPLIQEMHTRLGSCPFVVLTDPNTLSGLKARQELHGISFLPKPVEIDALFSAFASPDGSATSRSEGSSRQEQSYAANQNRHILLVEDNEINQVFIQRSLERRGFVVETAVNGAIACQMAGDRDFAAILMDVQMPVMDGLEATRRIRQDQRRHATHTPVIALTAGTSKAEKEECLHAGMDAFIAKPVSVPALLTTIDTLTRDSETPRKPSSPPGEQPTPLPDDFTRALHAAGGDSALLLELLEILEECWDSLVAAVDEAYEKDDAAALAKALHTVKGSVNMFGFEGFVEAIAGLMETARKGSPPPRQECSELLNRQTRWQKQLRLLAGRFDQGEQR